MNQKLRKQFISLVRKRLQRGSGSSLEFLNTRTWNYQSWVIQAIQNPNLSPDNLPIIPLPYLVVMKLQASRTQDLTDSSRMLGGADEITLEQVRIAVRSYCTDAVEDLESLIQIGKLER
ncbi:MAG TPA: hypothetical protein V6D31_09875 [Candidatus Sericytochromatia bacterium]